MSNNGNGTQSINSFGNDIFMSIARNNQGNNILISPPAIVSSLSMIGSEQSTKCDVDTIMYDLINSKSFNRNIKTNDIRMNVKVIDDESVTMNDLCKGLTETLSSESRTDCIKETSNKKKKFVRLLSNEGTVDKIGLGKSLIATSHFKGAWLKPFDRSQTELLTFYNHGSTKCPVSVEFISRWNHAYDILKPDYYTTGPNVTTIKIPLKNNLGMYIFMPTTNQDMAQLMKIFSPQYVDEQLEDFNFMSLRVVSIPKFKFCSNYELADPLADMGVDVSDTRSFLSTATINIDEEGNEGVPPKEVFVVKDKLSLKPSVIVDRPFIFMIRDNFGLTLFTGRIDCL